MLASITVTIDDARNITVEGEGLEKLSQSLLQKIERQMRIKAHQLKRRAIHQINAEQQKKLSEEKFEDVKDTEDEPPVVDEEPTETSPDTESLLAKLGLKMRTE